MVEYSLDAREIAGCALMFAAVILAQLSPLIERKHHPIMTDGGNTDES